MRKIKDSEIKDTAMIMAKCFEDYPLYGVFFPEGDKKLKQVFYFFWVRMYTRKNYSYVSEDMDVVISFKRPEDKDISLAKLLLNPEFTFGFLKYIPLAAIRSVLDFSRMEGIYQEKYFNPKTDCFVPAICVLKESRGNGVLFKALEELDDGRPIYCETHVEENVKLYEYMGLELCDETVWQGVHHYVMKKRGKYLQYTE